MMERIEINDEATGSSARILPGLGFNCYSWRPALADGPREMLWAEEGFADGQKRPSGSGIPLLFPFPGRIGGTSFTFDGREYRLEPGDAFGNAIHGFVFNRAWRIATVTKSCVVGEFQASLDDPGILDRWPADFRIRVSYEVRGAELLSDIRYEAVSERTLPCAFGTHAYFRLPLSKGGDPRETIVTAPVRSIWKAENMLPTGEKVAPPPDQALAGGLRLENHEFDTYFTDLTADADGRVRTSLFEPSSGRMLTQTFDRVFTQCVVYTPGHREAICLEPYTAVPDAFRLSAMGLDTGQQLLKPGDSFETTIRIEVTDPARES